MQTGRRDIPRVCRRQPSFLNQAVQVATTDSASGFPLGADMRNSVVVNAPRVRIRLKNIPRPLSYTAGNVLTTGYTDSLCASS